MQPIFHALQLIFHAPQSFFFTLRNRFFMLTHRFFHAPQPNFHAQQSFYSRAPIKFSRASLGFSSTPNVFFMCVNRLFSCAETNFSCLPPASQPFSHRHGLLRPLSIFLRRSSGYARTKVAARAILPFSSSSHYSKKAFPLPREGLRECARKPSYSCNDTSV